MSFQSMHRRCASASRSSSSLECFCVWWIRTLGARAQVGGTCDEPARHTHEAAVQAYLRIIGTHPPQRRPGYRLRIHGGISVNCCGRGLRLLAVHADAPSRAQ